MKIVVHRLLTVLILLSCVACASTPVTSPPATAIPSRVPVTKTAIPATVKPVVTLTPEVVQPQGPLVIRVVADNSNSIQPIVDIITNTAKLSNIAVTVDPRSPDGTYAIAALPDFDSGVDMWIGTEYDLQQLIRLGVVAESSIAIKVPHYDYVDEAVKRNSTVAVVPIALRNYLVGIGNKEYMDVLPGTTAELMGMSSMIRGKVRYKMAYPWPDGRLFSMMLDQLGASDVLTQTNSTLPADVLAPALKSMVDMRTLGPQDATTYVEATSNFINWYVPYTIDGDTAVRRYEKYKEELPLIFALPPLSSVTGRRMMPAVDVVYAIIPNTVTGERRTSVEAMATALQQPDAQAALFREMRWLPINRNLIESTTLSDDALFVALQPILPNLSTQQYNETVVCRWDAYEQILPLVLLEDIQIQAGVDAINTALQQCITKP